MVHKGRQTKAVHDGSNGGLPLLFIRLPVGTGPNVLQHRHVGKQGVILEHQPRMPLLGRQIDMLFRIEQHHIVHHDPAPVRLFDAGDALFFCFQSAESSGSLFSIAISEEKLNPLQ